MRNNHQRILNMSYAALCMALCLVLPFLTAQIPQIGSALSPMHIPVLLAGFLCGPWWGGAVGAVAPLLRHALFFAPPAPSCYAMAFELAAYGLVSGILYSKLSKRTANIYASLISAMLAGRIVGGIAMKCILMGKGTPYTFAKFAGAYFVTGLPGIVLHLVLVPLLVLALRRAGIVPAAHSHAHTEGHKNMKTEDIRAFFDACAPSWDADMIRNEAAISSILDAAGIRAGIDVLDVATGTGVLLPDYFARGVKSVTAIDLSPEMVRIAREKFTGGEETGTQNGADGNPVSVQILCGDVTREDSPLFRLYESAAGAEEPNTGVANRTADTAAAGAEEPNTGVANRTAGTAATRAEKTLKKYDAIVVYNAFPHFPDADLLFRTLASLLKDGGRLTIAHGMSREALNAHHSGSASKVSLYLEPAEEVAARMNRVIKADTVVSDPEKYIVSGTR